MLGGNISMLSKEEILARKMEAYAAARRLDSGEPDMEPLLEQEPEPADDTRKWFEVHVSVEKTLTVIVEADTEQLAIEKANNQVMSRREYSGIVSTFADEIKD